MKRRTSFFMFAHSNPFWALVQFNFQHQLSWMLSIEKLSSKPFFILFWLQQRKTDVSDDFFMFSIQNNGCQNLYLYFFVCLFVCFMQLCLFLDIVRFLWILAQCQKSFDNVPNQAKSKHFYLLLCSGVLEYCRIFL